MRRNLTLTQAAELADKAAELGDFDMVEIVSHGVRRWTEIPEVTSSKEMTMAARNPLSGSKPTPEPGQWYRHPLGAMYEIVALANKAFTRDFPLTLIYRGEDGKYWTCRPDQWWDDMTLVPDYQTTDMRHGRGRFSGDQK